jgi:hypothetical protein
MQALYNGPVIPWAHTLFTRRTLQTNCDVVFDFDWAAVIGHNQPKFPGLYDLSQAIAEFAKTCGKAPLLLLTDKADVPSMNCSRIPLISQWSISRISLHVRGDTTEIAILVAWAISVTQKKSSLMIGLPMPVFYSQPFCIVPLRVLPGHRFLL